MINKICNNCIDFKHCKARIYFSIECGGTNTVDYKPLTEKCNEYIGIDEIE